VRAALREALAAATAAQRGFAVEDDELCLDVLAKAGVEVIRGDGFDRNAFAAATEGVARQEAAEIDAAVIAAMRE
jgi:TRAP-type C4-dicarboxylate transport system substrate-binding protein